ncbi:MAG: RNA polymerase sigma factor [Phycisphaerales bacterium]
MPKDPVFLAQRAIAGDREALEVLWRQHRKWLAAVVMAHMPAEAELEDIVQEIAVAVVRTIGSLKNPQAIRPWLRSVAINTVRTAGRRATIDRRNRPQSVGDDFLDQSTFNRGEMTGQDAERSRLQVREALALTQDLPEHYREAILLRAVRGLSQAHIAEVLGISIKTVETRLRRARLMLTEQLVQQEGDDLTPDSSRASHGNEVNREC